MAWVGTSFSSTCQVLFLLTRLVLPDSYLTYSLPLGQGRAHDEDDQGARHIVELCGWLNVAAQHDWGDCRWRREENSYIEGRGTVAEHWVLLHNLWSISFKSLFLKSLQKMNKKLNEI